MSTVPATADAWLARLKAIWIGPPENGRDFGRANAEAVRNTIQSGDPNLDKNSVGGACVVLNMAAAHVPDFCRNGYKNVYELMVGGQPPRVSETRRFVDDALKGAFGIDPKRTWFAALELTGAGIRFYGDICLVLKRDSDPDLRLLDRNSYDLVRSPIKIEVGRDSVLCEAKARELGFYYQGELQSVAVLKVMPQTPEETDRRLTAGDIAEKLRADEDYIEVLWQCEIDSGRILEARTSASDAAADAMTAVQLGSGPTPSLAQLTSRSQRRAAQNALHGVEIPFRVVTTSGRIKG
ncbi:MAG: hypothetical protein ACHQPH_07335 [Reyranellales bacterium]